MKITKEDVRAYSVQLLKFLEDEKIKSFKDLEERVGEVFPLEGKGVVKITYSKSSIESSMTCIDCYDINNNLRMRIDTDKVGYQLIMIKCSENLSGYAIMEAGGDDEGNVLNQRALLEYDFNLLVKALEELRRE